ncbi:hypothetical protein N474_18710 [Pseudoalteromonas luteoviolacea CPMOR-2]|nr:hypothetical protein N474_18710 [Pseudoalteromonas luteoviolacea CPMOR-2]
MGHKLKKRIHIFWHFYLGIMCSIVFVSMLTITYFAHIAENYAIKAFILDVKQVVSRFEHKTIQSQQIESHGLKSKVLDGQQAKLFLNSIDYIDNIEGIAIYHDPQRDIYISAHEDIIKDRLLIIREIDFEQEFSQLSDFQKKEVLFIAEEDALNEQFQLTFVFSFVVTIAIVLLVLLAWLKRMLKPIEQASIDWREGNLSSRISAKSPEPLYSLSLTMNKMAEDIENMIEEQKVMSYAMSHEIRNPLNGLSLSIEILARQHTFLNNDVTYAKLKRYAGELESLSLNILTLAKVSNVDSEAVFEKCDISNTIGARVDFFVEHNPNIDFEIAIESDIKLKGLPLYFELIIDNIVSNASRYTNSAVLVSLTRQANTVELTVTDDGPGIKSEHLDYVMMPFSRLDYSRNKVTGGFGLGLAIVNSVVKRLGGHVQLENNKTCSGLKVTILLPHED